MKKKILVFGASGSIGRGILKEYTNHFKTYDVIGISTKSIDPKLSRVTSEYDILDLKLDKKSINGIIWAQGKNTNDSILNFNFRLYEDIMSANVTYILYTLSWIINNDLLSENAKLCIISSIWQEISRQDKLSYTISKSALKGLVLSLANDLSSKNVMVNAILPGVIDNSMTKKVLTKEQLLKFKNNNGNKNLANPRSIARTAIWLCSDESDGITGEFIKVDYGYSKTRTI